MRNGCKDTYFAEDTKQTTIHFVVPSSTYNIKLL